MKKLLSLLLAGLFICLTLASCSKAEDMEMGVADGGFEELGAAEEISPEDENYGKLVENEFVKAEDTPVSTFSADVDTASYAYFRKLVNSGYNLSELISTGGSSIRTEEMVNYFDYDYEGPAEGELFGKNVQIATCPWNENAVLMVLGLKSEEIEVESDNNLVFLIDVSGSMDSQDKLPLLKKAFSHLVSQLDESDRVSIVTYSGKEDVVLEGCEGSKSEKIMKAVNGLKAKGSTNGEAGLQKAYALAEKYFVSGGNNRIIMASDGDLNVGISSAEELKEYVSEKRDSGVYLSVLGFGTGNYKDSSMEALADNGNGVYYYIDGESEAEKVFGSDIFSTLYTVGKDVKLQITFNPLAVDSYRLIGYENRLLNKEDFEDDTKDAGDVGAGHAVTVCYELILTEDAMAESPEWMTLAVRYKRPDEDKSNLNEYKIGVSDYTEAPSDDFKFICGIVKTSMLLHDSKYLEQKGTSALKNIIEEISGIDLSADNEKKEFLDLLKKLHGESLNDQEAV
ncbi:MAG: VWA domain-containing protein [Clostridia bacterium]|nr:VWA domain-containing protein [Clostridia bacterium]